MPSQPQQGKNAPESPPKNLWILSYKIQDLLSA